MAKEISAVKIYNQFLSGQRSLAAEAERHLDSENPLERKIARQILDGLVDGIMEIEADRSRLIHEDSR